MKQMEPLKNLSNAELFKVEREDLVAMKAVELLGRILARDLVETDGAAGVPVREIGQVKHVSVNDAPQVVWLVVLGDVCMRF